MNNKSGWPWSTPQPLFNRFGRKVSKAVAAQVRSNWDPAYNTNNNWEEYLADHNAHNNVRRYQNILTLTPQASFDRLFRVLKRETDGNLIKVAARSIFNVLDRFEWKDMRAWGRSYTKFMLLLKVIRNRNRGGINQASIARGAANNSALAQYISKEMNNSAAAFNRKTKWGRRANKNNARVWYNNTTGKIKKINSNVIYNIIGLNNFKPGIFNGNTKLYFDARDPKRHLFTRNGIVGSQGINPYYGKNVVDPYLLPRDVNQAVGRFILARNRARA